MKVLVGLPGFEPESIEPKSTSLDQASRQPHAMLGAEKIISLHHKNLSHPNPAFLKQKTGGHFKARFKLVLKTERVKKPSFAVLMPLGLSKRRFSWFWST
jgi:hypothetical protein